MKKSWKAWNIAFHNFLEHNNMEKWACPLSYSLYQPHGCWWRWRSSQSWTTFIGPIEAAGAWDSWSDPSAQPPAPAFWLRNSRSQLTRVWKVESSRAKQDREAQWEEELGILDLHTPLVQSVREPHGREREPSFLNEQATEDTVGCGVGSNETLGGNCLCISVSGRL